MEMTAVVLYEGALAHFDVEVGRNGICTARLARYSGKLDIAPTQTIRLHKEGRHWVSDDSNSSLSDDLGYAIEQKAKPILEERKRRGEPAG
jgi:hypothetical protein